MPTGRLKATDPLAWGKLVKSWATRRNYVDYPDNEASPIPQPDEPSPKYPLPGSFYDFVEQCIKAKVGLIYEDTGTAVQPSDQMGFVPLVGNSLTFVLRLPPKDKIDDTEAKMKGGQPYVVGDFYGELFECPMKPELLDTNVKRFRFHANRVGDYTIAGCM